MKGFLSFTRPYFDIVCCITVIFLFVINHLYFSNSVVQNVLAIPVLLFIPGYLFLSSLYADQRALSPSERTIGAFATSVSFAILLGMVLDQTSFGFSTDMILLILLTFCCVFFLISFTQRLRATAYKTEISTTSGISKPYLYYIVFGVITAMLLTFYYMALFPSKDEAKPTTQFYLDPITSKGKEVEVTLDEMNNAIYDVKLVLVNLEGRTIKYSVFQEINEGNKVLVAEMLLANQERWEDNISIKIPNNAYKETKVSFLLQKETESVVYPYRQIYFWVKE